MTAIGFEPNELVGSLTKHVMQGNLNPASFYDTRRETNQCQLQDADEKGTMIVSGMSNEDMVLIHTQLKLIHRLRVIAGCT